MSEGMAEAVVERRARWLTLAWLVPLGAAVAVVVLVVQSRARAGEEVTIAFEDARGIGPADAVVYRGLRVGVVREVELSPTGDRALVRVRLRPDAAALAVEGTAWWVATPEFSLRRVSGLETLLGPRYVGMRPGPLGGARRREFEGMSSRPALEPSTDGLEVVLRAPKLGSLGIGSPVTYRDIVVGEVRGFELSADSRFVEVHARVEPRYAPLVRANSRFWNSSGIGVDFGLFGGLSVRAESIESVMTGGIAFATPTRAGDRVESGHAFDLASQVDSEWLRWAPTIELEGGPMASGR